MSRCPSQRTLRARQVTHVLEGFFDGLEVIMDHECGREAGTGSDHRVSGLEGEIQCAFEADGETLYGVTSLEGRRSTEAEGRFQTTKLGSLGSELGWTGTEPASQQQGG